MGDRVDKGRKFWALKMVVVLMFYTITAGIVLTILDKPVVWLTPLLPVLGGGIISYMLANAYSKKKGEF